MPCIVNDYELASSKPEQMRAAASALSALSALSELQLKNDRLDSLLCSAMRALTRLGYDREENPALSEWYAEHQRKDELRESAAAAARLRHEQVILIAKKPFDQLTAEDKQLLKEAGLL